MRALSVRQPWAWAIAYAGKTVENRSRRFNHEGLVAIHASLGLDEPGFFPRNEAGHTAARKLDALGGRSNFWDARHFYIGGHRHPGLGLGAIIAVARFDHCHYSADCHAKCSPWAIDGQWHICLDDVRPLAEPVPARGKLGLWTVPEDVESAVRAQIEVSTNG
jgi:hypothetical protein